MEIIEPVAEALDDSASMTSSSRVSEIPSSGDEREAKEAGESEESENLAADVERRGVETPVGGEVTPVCDEEGSAKEIGKDEEGLEELSVLGEDKSPEQEQELMEAEYGRDVMGPDRRMIAIRGMQKKRKWMDEARHDITNAAERMVIQSHAPGELMMFEPAKDSMGRAMKVDVWGSRKMPTSELRPGWFPARQLGEELKRSGRKW